MRDKAVTWLCIGSGLLGLLYLMTPNFIRARHRTSHMNVCRHNLKELGTALELYSTDFDGRYPRNLKGLTPNYLRTIPECREAKYQSYRYEQGPNATGNTVYNNYYYMECSGTNHKEIDYAPNYPRYDAVNGLVGRP